MKKVVLLSILTASLFVQESSAKWCSRKSPGMCIDMETTREYMKEDCGHPRQCLSTFKKNNNINDPAVWSFVGEMDALMSDKKRRSTSMGFEHTSKFKEHQRRSAEARKKAMEAEGLFQND